MQITNVRLKTISSPIRTRAAIMFESCELRPLRLNAARIITGPSMPSISVVLQASFHGALQI